MTTGLTLFCPVRGILKTPAKSADGLTPTEEKFRVDALNHIVGLGYPKNHILVEPVVKRFGHGGHNSFRADFAVLDVPVSSVARTDVSELLEHALILGEVKRDNRGADQAKHTQVEPMLDFAARNDCLAVYWDNLEQRVYWRHNEKGKRQFRDGPIALLPKYGHSLQVAPLTLGSIAPSASLLRVFERIEDILHTALDAEERYSTMLQLLLAKLYDEQGHEAAPNTPLDVQDFKSLGTAPASAIANIEALIARAIGHYGHYLSNPVPKKLAIRANVLLDILEILAPIKILASRQSAVQEFYMYFAKHLYRWDLAQYFTPTPVTEFIVEVANPQFGETVKDPACGGADFLVAAFVRGRAKGIKHYSSLVWGADNSRNAVQVAVLNMLLNGDGKSNIVLEDSLAKPPALQYRVIICNPPFGLRITEKRATVLRQYALGHEWDVDAAGIPQQSAKLRTAQETGLLFAEVCLNQCEPGGRIAIILPNGYLGNRGKKYLGFREWLLRQCRVASICSFPRFTFKKSGADVSASIVYLEKRLQPLQDARADAGYRFNVELIERVGWQLGDKKGSPTYSRDPKDGSLLTTTGGDIILDADFSAATDDIRSSAAVSHFPWLVANTPPPTSQKPGSGWSVDIADVLSDQLLTLDPKRHSRKFHELRAAISANPHYVLGDIVEFLPEQHTSAGSLIRIRAAGVYHYVELQDVRSGDFHGTPLSGWQMPTRARHLAEPRDIFVGSVWGSVGKWFIAPDSVKNVMVTNGFHRLRLKPGKERLLLDLIAALGTEAYAAQMRALSRGSDGLAEVSPPDAATVLIPKIGSTQARKALQPFIDALNAGRSTVGAKLMELADSGVVAFPLPPPRASHTSLV